MSTKESKKVRTSNGRPVQPKCPHCGKAMYKRMDAGAVKTEDSYGWCRNAACDHFNVDQSGASRFKALEGVEAKPSKVAKLEEAAGITPKAKSIAPPKAKTTILPPAAASTKAKTLPPGAIEAPKAKKAKQEAEPAPVAAKSKSIAPEAVKAKPLTVPPSDDPAEMIKARRRIKKIIAAEGDSKASAIGAALGILNHEAGNTKLGDKLIQELGLSEYGINPVGEGAKKRKKKKGKRAVQAEA
jgi:hypothetical protein